MELSQGFFWIHGGRQFEQYQLFEPGLDGITLSISIYIAVLDIIAVDYDFIQ